MTRAGEGRAHLAMLIAPGSWKNANPPGNYIVGVREGIHNEGINVGESGENYQIRDVADIVQGLP